MKLYDNLPKLTLEHLEDLRSAGYSEAVIMENLNIPLVPPKEMVFYALGRCSRCSLSDHLLANCPGVCLFCHKLGFKCANCEGPSRVCGKCLGIGHSSTHCSVGLRCWTCKLLGHRARFCLSSRSSFGFKNGQGPRLKWVVNNSAGKDRNISRDSGDFPLLAVSPPCLATEGLSYAAKLENPPQSASLEVVETSMANIPVMPFPFLPGPMQIEHGPDNRLQHNMICVGDPPLSHDRYALVSV